MLEHETKPQICSELQTLRDWGDKNVQIQNGTEAPPKEKWKKDYNGRERCYIDQPINTCGCVTRVKKCRAVAKLTELWLRLTENMTTHNLDLEEGSVFKQQFIKCEMKFSRCYISEM